MGPLELLKFYDLGMH